MPMKMEVEDAPVVVAPAAPIAPPVAASVPSAPANSVPVFLPPTAPAPAGGAPAAAPPSAPAPVSVKAEPEAEEADVFKLLMEEET